MYAAGLMSGTSLDGVDTVLVKIEGHGTKTDVKMIGFNTYEIPEDIKSEIRKACSIEESDVRLICSLNFKLGYLFADCVKKLCRENSFDIEKLDFIASHGQTIFHIPRGGEGFAKSTLQIGESAVIAYETRTKVVSNFRTMDMAAGGEGAPLVPYSEYVLYGGRDEGVLLQNIGGIGNVTVVPRNASMEDIYAFDTGPGNMIIDELMQRLFNKKYDEGGKAAAAGRVNGAMLDEMMSEPYIRKNPPKTTGRELFGAQYVDRLLKKYGSMDKNDMVATATMFTAASIAENYKKYILPEHDIKKAILGGGGAHNMTLIRYMKELLPGIEITTQDEEGASSDAKEAIAFVIMGNETLNGGFSNVPGATGAKEKVILGTVCENPFKYREDSLK